MRSASPLWPGHIAAAVIEGVHVDVLPGCRVTPCQLIDVTGEEIVTHRLLQEVHIAYGVIWMYPVRVLEDNGVLGDTAKVVEGTLQRRDKLVMAQVDFVVECELLVMVEDPKCSCQ